MPDVPAVLAPLCERPERSALFLDFDGTLSPIVDDPAAARPLPEVPGVLARLADRLAVVAVVSGRPIAFLLEVLGQPAGVHLAGLYGMETARPGEQARTSEEVAPWRPIVAEVTRLAAAEAPPGAGVEAKGLTMTLHWRGHPETEPWARRFADRETARTGLVGQPGRMALELRPPIAVDKGSVVRQLAPGHAAVGCFGDDLGDLPAFRALDELAGAGVAVARVAVVDAESPPEVAAAADLVVEGPQGALALLELLAGES